GLPVLLTLPRPPSPTLFPTRRSSDLAGPHRALVAGGLEFLAVAHERDRRLRRTAREQGRALRLHEGRVRRIGAERGEQREAGGAGFEIDRGREFAPAV